MTDEAIEEIKKELLPLVTLITPNIDEAKVLTGKSIHNIQDMQTAAKMLTDDYQTNVLLKGGHLEGDNMCDLLHTSEFIIPILMATGCRSSITASICPRTISGEMDCTARTPSVFCMVMAVIADAA